MAPCDSCHPVSWSFRRLQATSCHMSVPGLGTMLCEGDKNNAWQERMSRTSLHFGWPRVAELVTVSAALGPGDGQAFRGPGGIASRLQTPSSKKCLWTTPAFGITGRPLPPEFLQGCLMSKALVPANRCQTSPSELPSFDYGFQRRSQRHCCRLGCLFVEMRDWTKSSSSGRGASLAGRWMPPSMLLLAKTER